MEFDIKVMNPGMQYDEFYETETLAKAKSRASRKSDSKFVYVVIRNMSGVILSERIKGRWSN